MHPFILFGAALDQRMKYHLETIMIEEDLETMLCNDILEKTKDRESLTQHQALLEHEQENRNDRD